MNKAVRYQVMPPLASDEYQELYEDIRANGVIEPIHVDEGGIVIDGHHRSKIASELGIPCPVITHDDLDDAGKRSLAFTLNLKRRHLNREQRRALIAESLKADPQLSNREHARRTGSSPTTAGEVRREMEDEGRLSKLDSRISGDGRERPSTQPSRTPEPAPVPESPHAAVLPQEDLDELNAPIEERSKSEPQKPRAEAITSRFTSAIVDLNRVLDKFNRIVTDANFHRNKEKVAATHRHDLNRAISELQTLADQLD